VLESQKRQAETVVNSVLVVELCSKGPRSHVAPAAKVVVLEVKDVALSASELSAPKIFWSADEKAAPTNLPL
jgi:hypothetical protein